MATMVRARRWGRLAATAALVTGLAACESVWGQFRAGPERTGHNAEEAEITAGNVAGLEVAWTIDLPDATSAVRGLAVGAGKVVLPTGDGMVRAVDPATGATVWSVSAPGVREVAVSGGRVFLSTSDRNVSALDAATGARLWRRATLGDPSPPTVVGDRVYVTGTDGRLTTYDVATGVSVAPAIPVAGAGRLAVSTADGSFYLRTDRVGDSSALYLQGYGADGTVRWSVAVAAVPSGGLPPDLTPMLADGRVYLGGRAYDQATGDLVWASPSADWFSSLAYDGGTVYGLRSFTLGVSALDPATGAVRWTSASTGNAFPVAGDGPAVTPGLVWVNAGRATRALDAATGAVLWSSDAAIETSEGTMPVVAGGRVYSFTLFGDLVAWHLP